MQTRLTLGTNANKMWIPYLYAEAEYEKLLQLYFFYEISILVFLGMLLSG